jgi:hypothetical protein
MTQELISAAIAGIYLRTAELLRGVHDHDGRKQMVDEAKRMADKVLALGEPPIKPTREQ